LNVVIGLLFSSFLLQLFFNLELFITAFVSRKVIFGKPLSKLSCVCLPLEKLVNGKHFLVNRKHFPVKEKFGLVFKKVFFFYFGRKTLSRSCEKN
jgi:hypothetical protein